MLEPGRYKHEHYHEYSESEVYVGKIILDVKEIAKSIRLKLVYNSVRYDAPQIDAMFANGDSVKINKSGSVHALQDWGDNSFTLYPYRVGVPYVFRIEE
jgi:hypothetical protein